MRLRALVASVAVAAGCGGPAPKQPGAGARLDVPKIAIPAAKREASEGLRRRWPFDERVRFALYADGDTMMKMDLFRALASAAPERCIADAVAHMRELAAGGDQRGFLVLARFGTVPEGALRTCLDPLAGDAATLAVDGDVALFGERGLVAAAMRGGAGAWPSSLSLTRDGVVSWSARVDGISAQGGVWASSERFRADASAELPEQVATLLEDRLAHGGALGPLARALTFERKDGRVAVALELGEPPIDQARDLGTLAALATHGVRAYLTRAKTAEAKSTLGAIARAYVVAWETERDATPRAKKKLRSYPPVPKAVPRGVVNVSQDADWAAWKDLRFVMSGTQRYQYEIVASKDGESAEIVARGDLNGDGKTSLFRVTVKIDRAKDLLTVSPEITEIEPDE